MNITLFELASEYRATADLLTDMDLPPEVVADTLESISGDIQAKATNVAAFVRNLESSAAAIKDAEASMAARRKAIENRAAQVRQYLMDNMERAGISKIESPMFRVSIRQNPESVAIEDERMIPADYMREIPATYAPDKTLMKKALQDGFDIPGAKLVRTHRLEIK